MSLKSLDIAHYLRLDWRDEGNKQEIKKLLCKLKPFKKYKDTDEMIPLPMLEKMMSVLCRKYCVQPQYMNWVYIPTNKTDILRVSMKRDDTHEWLDTIQCCCIHEVMAKAVLCIFYHVKVDEIPAREIKEEE